MQSVRKSEDLWCKKSKALRMRAEGIEDLRGWVQRQDVPIPVYGSVMSSVNGVRGGALVKDDFSIYYGCQ